MNIDINALKNPSKISKSIRLGLLIGIFALAATGGYFQIIDPKINELNVLAAKEKDLRAAWLEKKSQAVNLELYKKQLQEIEVTFGALLKQLPNKSEMDALLNDINQAGIGRGLNFNLFRPSNERMTEYYAEMPVSIKVVGSFQELGLFAEDVSGLNRIVHLDDFTLSTADAKQNPVKLSLDGTAKTFRYLDKKGGKK